MTWYWPDWLLHLLPGLIVYQTLGTIRHELSHVVAGRLAGDAIKDVVIYPHTHNGLFYWGRVEWGFTGNSMRSVHRYLAPYYVAMLVFIGGVVFVKLMPEPAHESRNYFNWWLFSVMNLVVSPMVDLLYNLYKWQRHGRGDFAKAAKE